MAPTATQLSPQEQQILSQFADIILPEQIGWWPFSLQLWAVLFVLTLTCAAFIFLIIRKQKKQRYKKLALHKLSKIQASLDGLPINSGYQQINELLKSSLLAGGVPRQKLAALHGEEWFHYLLSHVPEQKQQKIKDHQSTFSCWSKEAYSANKTDISHLAEFVDFAKQIITFHTPGREVKDA